mmetsp:Transcript_53912/g.159753  ORF Transcript_53912/g.159753 Transcript_53912/m.159753 type:complete len:739 (+) Transcript_53912:589-2805(+)
MTAAAMTAACGAGRRVGRRLSEAFLPSGSFTELDFVGDILFAVAVAVAAVAVPVALLHHKVADALERSVVLVARRRRAWHVQAHADRAAVEPVELVHTVGRVGLVVAAAAAAASSLASVARPAAAARRATTSFGLGLGRGAGRLRRHASRRRRGLALLNGRHLVAVAQRMQLALDLVREGLEVEPLEPLVDRGEQLARVELWEQALMQHVFDHLSLVVEHEARGVHVFKVEDHLRELGLKRLQREHHLLEVVPVLVLDDLVPLVELPAGDAHLGGVLHDLLPLDVRHGHLARQSQPHLVLRFQQALQKGLKLAVVHGRQLVARRLGRVRVERCHERLELHEGLRAQPPRLELREVARALDAKHLQPRRPLRVLHRERVLDRALGAVHVRPRHVGEHLLAGEHADEALRLVRELARRRVEHKLAVVWNVGHLQPAHQRRHRHAVGHDGEEDDEDRHQQLLHRQVAAVEPLRVLAKAAGERRRDATFAPHLGRIERRVVHAERECQADGAAQPAPPHDDRLAPRAARPHPRERREEERDRGAARQEHERVDHEDLPPVGLPQHQQRAVTHEEAELRAAYGKDDRVQDVRGHPVQLVQEVEDVRRDVRAVVVAVEPHDHHADHGRRAADQLADPKAEVRHGEHDGPLDELLVVHQAAHGHGRPAKANAVGDAEDQHLCDDPEELGGDVAHEALVDDAVLQHPAGRHDPRRVADAVAHPRVEHDGRAVVEQALALDERAERL